MGRRIERRQAVEHAAERPGQPGGAGEPERDAGEGHDESAPEHEPRHVATLRAERHAHGDLSYDGDRVRQHAGEPSSVRYAIGSGRLRCFSFNVSPTPTFRWTT
jgi:hypothetical protein